MPEHAPVVVRDRLDLRAKLYQSSLRPHVLRVARGERLAAPLVVDLDPTTFCDLECPECISARVLATKQFSVKRLQDLARELVDVGVRGVILIGGGEPLLHPGIREVFSILGCGGIHIGLVTNGTLLHRYRDEVEAHTSWVRVSVDAATAATYNRFRPSRRGASVFDTVVQNIASLSRNRSVTVGYSFVAMTRTNGANSEVVSNITEIHQAGHLAKELGCRYFELKAMMSPDHFVVRPNEDALKALAIQVARLDGLCDETFSVLRSSSVTSLLSGEADVQKKQYRTCRVAELRTLITPTGVYMCSYHRGEEGARLGDVMTESFADLWARANRSIVDPARDCQFHCARHASNLELHSASFRPEASAVVSDYDVFL